MDQLTKSAHFIPIYESISAEKLADIYVREMVARHGVPMLVVSDRDVRFTYRFWKKFHEELGTQVGDFVLLKVLPWKRVIRLRKRGKLGLRYIGMFSISARVSKVAYRFDLPDELNQIHNTFHVSQLQNCVTDEAAVVSLDDIQVDESRNYIERPVAILDRKTKVLRNKEVKLVKVQWQH
ncbi:uncharacterized protein LOC122197196 [Lactuca sativa]|uniref:uncharacterized protein LOC122197196 n=1 Tax=Lactuca sativa TaxID=4236 RepID=UPI001C692EFC|nr:uncharacterized protein LOC122197196 [Lactuca sativa]